MTEAYHDALREQLNKNVWDTLKREAMNMSPLEYASVATDIAGIFDPTPASDTAGLVLSVAQGDWFGAVLSLGSMVPYAGDALAKPLKIAKYAPRTARALEAVFRASDNLAEASGATLKQLGLSLEQVAAARRQALERVQRAFLDARNKVPGCKDCAKAVNPKTGRARQLQMPRSAKGKGAWDTPPPHNPPLDGNGVFVFDNPKVLPDGRQVTGIEFRNGTPNFDEYVNGPKYDLWEVSGNAELDEARLTAMMREKDPGWSSPSSDDYVLHHLEDGQVGYVPRVLHDRDLGGVAHTGGNSMINNPLF